ncbi:tRNA pseudouridine(55) synthase TruB [Alicyclobacillus cycloheptanicus]|uniref:tRNA pseudouridine synthase B n=1 Tax=Alicyclobacillus cycloheptanicus TaxID=1457 RepID=A0ABT9XHU1_9BACL|nr:tRNA pseudouridine(55) synthase TruB [Alicyclobacillus cycloheptanicus]MDQ0189271.1 tRNA pseudouridine55 synthase [Alicyclobacillus cycloheptanicus]WDM01363.1 tRNA pseudouridine(55) synthase TruB [Alicyclobacillus cycloheptanicus]
MSVSGVLILDKPKGLTSHDVVARVRRVLGTRRVGHAGTLDPDATGVLVVCVGDATRLAEYVAADEKSYDGTVVFGISTDTDDAAGRVLAQASAAQLTEEQVAAAAERLTGVQSQTAPRVSAVHVQGKRAHELVRAGQAFEAPVRTVVIRSLLVHSFQPGELATAAFSVTCSKGTYVRALCRDWGAALGLPAHMGALRRTRSGVFSIDDATPLEVWEASERPAKALLPPVAALQEMPKVVIDHDTCMKLARGQSVRHSAARDVPDGTLCAAVTSDGQLAAIAEVSGAGASGYLAPKKVFWKKD